MKNRLFILTCHPGSNSGGVGLGHILITIFNCAHYAKTWGRTLVLDMQGFPYFSKNNHEQFFEYFEFSFPEDLDVITDIEDVKSVYNFEGVNDTIEKTMKKIMQRKFTRLRIQDDLIDDVIYSSGHLTNNILNEEESKNYGLKLKGILEEQVNETLSNHFINNKTIGVHYRHGNGEFLHDRFDSTKTKNYDEKLLLIKHEIIKNVNFMVKQNNLDNPRIYLASDNLEFVQSLNKMIPNSFYITEDLPDTDFILFLEKNDYRFDFLKNTVVDLWALSLCDYIVCVPSLFVDLAVLNSQHLSSDKVVIIKKFCLHNIVKDWDAEEAIYAASAGIKYTDNAQPFEKMLKIAKSRKKWLNRFITYILRVFQ